MTRTTNNETVTSSLDLWNRDGDFAYSAMVVDAEGDLVGIGHGPTQEAAEDAALLDADRYFMAL